MSHFHFLRKAFRAVGLGTLSYKILFFIVLFSSFVTLFVTVIQLYSYYQEQTEIVEKQMIQIEQSYSNSLAKAMWDFDVSQIEKILAGIMKFEDVHYAGVQILNGETYHLGEQRHAENLRYYEVGVKYETLNRIILVGHLSIESNLKGVVQRLTQKFWLVLISQALKTFIVSIFILFIFYYLVVRHLIKLAAYTSSISIDKQELISPLILDRRESNNDFVDELGQVVNAINNMQTQLVGTVSKLRENESRFRNLFENSEVSIWNEDFSSVYKKLETLRMQGVTDLKSYLKENPETAKEMASSIRVNQVNTVSLKLFGAENKAELIEQIDKTFGSDSLHIFINELCAIWDRKSVFRSEVGFLTLDGRDITCIISFQIPQTAYAFNSIPVSILDITSYKETERSLQRAQKMKAVGQMAGGLAHDFNNILGIIIGNLSFLKRECGQDEKKLKRLNTADKAAKRAADLTRQLLGFSRQQPQQVQPTDINKVIKGLDNLIARSVTLEIEIEQHFSDDLWLTDIDSADFEDVLLNLLLNARDSMSQGGILTIDTSNKVLDLAYAEKNISVVPGDYVELVINDTGKGIAKENLEHIFDPFFTTKPNGKGTGLGLSMVFGFIQRSKGQIKVYSELGIGTTIRCYLPRSTNMTEIQQILPADKVQLPRGQETVLAVDDEPDLLSLVQQYLEVLGYTVVTATSGRQALDILTVRPNIHLLFSDVIMPGGMNGYELAEQATTLYPQLKVLLTSGYSSKMLYRNGQARFKANLLNKPYSHLDIATRIRLILDGEVS